MNNVIKMDQAAERIRLEREERAKRREERRLELDRLGKALLLDAISEDGEG